MAMNDDAMRDVTVYVSGNMLYGINMTPIESEEKTQVKQQLNNAGWTETSVRWNQEAVREEREDAIRRYESVMDCANIVMAKHGDLELTVHDGDMVYNAKGPEIIDLYDAVYDDDLPRASLHEVAASLYDCEYDEVLDDEDLVCSNTLLFSYGVLSEDTVVFKIKVPKDEEFDFSKLNLVSEYGDWCESLVRSLGESPDSYPNFGSVFKNVNILLEYIGYDDCIFERENIHFSREWKALIKSVMVRPDLSAV